MPFYIEKYSDGSQFSMTESMAILRHLGRKYSLYGDGSIQHMAKVDMLVDVAVELRLIFVNLTYFGDVEKEKSDYFKKTGLKFFEVSSIVIRRVSLGGGGGGGGGGLFDGRGFWGPTKSRVQKDPSFLKTPK